MKRLESLFKDIQEGREPTYTIEHLYQKIRPSSLETFTLILSELAHRGLIEKIIRLESPTTGGGIADYSTLLDVPDEIYDPRSDRQIEVRPENLRVLFKLHSA